MVEILACPIATSMGVLGRKWAMVLLRDVVMTGPQRFRDFLHASPDLTPRVLSRRLAELQEEGYLLRREADDCIHYEATDRGMAAAPILEAIANFGMQQYPERVFEDARPRSLSEFAMATQDGVGRPRANLLRAGGEESG